MVNKVFPESFKSRPKNHAKVQFLTYEWVQQRSVIGAYASAPDFSGLTAGFVGKSTGRTS